MRTISSKTSTVVFVDHITAAHAPATIKLKDFGIERIIETFEPGDYAGGILWRN